MTLDGLGQKSSLTLSWQHEAAEYVENISKVNNMLMTTNAGIT